MERRARRSGPQRVFGSPCWRLFNFIPLPSTFPLHHVPGKQARRSEGGNKSRARSQARNSPRTLAPVAVQSLKGTARPRWAIACKGLPRSRAMAYQQQPYNSYQQRPQQPYYDQGRPQQQHADYAAHYDQQYYDYGNDQGYDQWSDGYYDQQGRWVETPAQQFGGRGDVNGYARQPPHGQQGPGQNQDRRPSREQYASQQQAYAEPQQQRAPRPDARTRPSGRGNGAPPNSQPARGGLRPPGEFKAVVAGHGVDRRQRAALGSAC
jgi:hypothetical protein